MKRIGRVVGAVVCGLVANAWAEGGPRIGAGPKLLSEKKFDITRLYAPVVDGNPPPRVDDPKLKYDSFLPAKALMDRIDACGGTALLAFKEAKLNRGWYLGKAYIKEEEFENARATVFSQVPNVYDVTAEYVPGGKIIGPDESFRPQRIVRIKDSAAIDELRKHVMVDYVEPSCANDLQLFSGFGCFKQTQDGLLKLPADEANADPREQSTQLGSGEWVPWSYRELGVPGVWDYLERKGQLPGALVTVGHVDTGLSQDEPEMTTEFTATKGVSPMLDFAFPLTDSFDTCDHGTRMASFSTAPQNGAMMVGIGKHSQLLANRIGDGVVHAAGREQIGDAIERAARASQVVTFAWGMPFASQAIADSITTSLIQTQVVFLAAAGTLVPGNLSFFPATLRNETISVTPIAPKRGTATEFERLPPGQVSYNDGVDILGIANVDNEAGPSIGLNVGEFSTFGGSSAASAELAGVFALSAASFQAINRRFPTREELVSRVLSHAFQDDRLSSESFVNGRSPMVGLGLVNVYAAVGGFVSVSIEGNRSQIAGQPFTLIARPEGDGPMFSYEWRIDGSPTVISTSSSPTFVVPVGLSTRDFTLTVTEAQTNVVHTATATIRTAPTHPRVLYARDLVSSFATFLDGQRVDVMVNQDLATVPGCNVRDVLGQEYVKDARGNIVPFGAPVTDFDGGNRGFRVSRPGTWLSNQQSIAPEGLNVFVHAWHDGFSAVRVRAVYVFDEPSGVDCLTGVLQETP